MAENDQDTKEQLLKKFLLETDIPRPSTKHLFAIGLIGLNGSGKSTICQALGERLNIYTASNDRIRRFLNQQGFEGDAPIQETLQYLAESVGKYLYENKISHIIDADLIKFHESARQNAESYGARLYFIDVQCPDEVIRDRIKKRSQSTQKDAQASLSRADIEEYEKRKLVHAATIKPQCDFIIHSDEDIAPQIERIASSIEDSRKS